MTARIGESKQGSQPATGASVAGVKIAAPSGPETLPVAVLVVGYGSAAHLGHCLESLLRSSPPPAEVIVVDNASPEPLSGEVARFSDEARAAGIRVVSLRTQANVGFGRGNVAGLLHATQPFVLLLNPDAELEPQALGKLFVAFRSLEQPAVVQGLVVFKGDRTTINSAGVAAYLDGGFADVLCGAPLARIPAATPVPIAAATGACSLLRREDIERLGFFDPDFFLYVEDVDLGLRWRRAGAGAYLIPAALVFHDSHGSSGNGNGSFAFEVSCNQVETVAKNYPTFEAAIAGLLWSYNTARLLMGRGTKEGRVRVAAGAHQLRRWRVLLAKRRAVLASGPDERIRPWIWRPPR